MRARFAGRIIAPALAAVALLSAARAATSPEGDFAAIVKAFLSPAMVTDWSGLEALPSIRWAAPAPTSLQNCLPDGGCYTRQGTASPCGRNLAVVVTGARTIVSYIYMRNGSAPLGEAAVLEALRQAGIQPELARCPVRGGTGGTNWYRLTGEGLSPGVLSVQTVCNGRPCEGFVLSQGEALPKLQPNQVSLYSEQCAADAVQQPVSTLKPHELLAQTIVALLPPASGPALPAWPALAAVASGIAWSADGPKPGNLTHLNDANPMIQTGSATLAERPFSAVAAGTAEQVKVVYLDEGGLHPRGEHVLGVVYEKGIAVQLVRCGPVYTESTNNWYRLTSAGTRPVMIRQSIRYDGNQVQDSYALRLDGTLPARDPRDRDPGVSGCR